MEQQQEQQRRSTGHPAEFSCQPGEGNPHLLAGGVIAGRAGAHRLLLLLAVV